MKNYFLATDCSTTIHKNDNHSQIISLRDYQAGVIREIYELWKVGKLRVLAQLPTGGGKTVIFAAIARDLLQERILVLVHREELLTQAKAKLEAVCGVDVGIIKAGYEARPECLIQVASVQSLARRNMPHAGLVIVDEAHHCAAPTYRAILENYPKSYVLGVSATPIRSDGTGFDDLFDELAIGPSVKELIEAGHLARFKLFADPNPISVKGVRTVAGDYSNAQLAATVDAGILSGSLIGMYLRFSRGKRAVVFAINTTHSREIAARYRNAGISAEHLDSNTDSVERTAILDRFRRGETLVLCNCGIVSEGFDLPAIETVQIARPTKSLSLWLQMVGRGLRPCEGKDYAVILDHTDNYLIHGLPDASHIWTLEGIEPHPPRLKRSPDGQIEEAEEIPPPPEIIETNSDFIEIQESSEARLIQELAALDRLFSIQESRQYKPSWVAYKFLESKPSHEALKVCAKRLGYRQGWAWVKFCEMQNTSERGAA